MSDLTELEQKLIAVKQRLFDEAVEGNPREPHECVDMVLHELEDLWPSWRGYFQTAISYYPEY